MSDTASATSPLTEREALMAYATMFNTGNPEVFLPLLAEDFTHTSQNVITDMVGKQAYVQYITIKLETMRNARLMPLVDLGFLPGWGHSTCAVLWQGNPPETKCVAYADVAEGLVKAIHLCIAPSPKQAKLMGLWPGLPADRRPPVLHEREAR